MKRLTMSLAVLIAVAGCTAMEGSRRIPGGVSYGLVDTDAVGVAATATQIGGAAVSSVHLAGVSKRAQD